MPEAFYERDGDRFVATELTRGPWDPGAQHAGPPSALLGREIERLEDAEEFQIGRVTFEIMRSVPIGPVSVEAKVVRPGRRVQLIEASLANDDGELVRARAWRLRTGAAPVELPLRSRPRTHRPGQSRGTSRSSSRLGRTPGTTRRWSGRR